MKANELMIGDWVCITKNFTQKYHRIRALSNDDEDVLRGTYTNNYGVECSSIFSCNNVEPILLTAEILEKNGFVAGDGFWMSADHRIILHNEDIYLNTFNKWHVHVDTEDMRTIGSIELTYVHQLQQFLRLCGLDNMANNFKV